MRVIDTHVRLVDLTGADSGAAREALLASHADSTQQCTSADCAYAAYRDGVVDSFVHVSSAKVRELCLAEAALVEQIAQLHDLDLVMIAGVDPERPTQELLADLDALAGSESFRGVRLPFGAPASLDFVPDLLAWLNERELVVEISPLADQVQGWVSALERHQKLVSVVGYDGWVIKPVAEVTDEWRKAFQTYADGNVDRWQITLPNDGRTAHVPSDLLWPWLETAAEILGWERMMFASALPLEAVAPQYPQIIESFVSMMSSVSEDDKARFWSENAAAAYRM